MLISAYIVMGKEQSIISEDYLIGLYNKRQLDIYLKNCITNPVVSESLFAIIMMDIRTSYSSIHLFNNIY